MIIRRRIEHGFSILPRAAFEDTRLSYEARGVLGYILVKPDNWQVHVTDLARNAGGKGCGRDRIYRILDELKATGYMRYEQARDTASGRLSAAQYIVSDQPVITGPEVSEKPEAGNPDTAEPDTENPDAYEELTSTDHELKPRTDPPPAPQGGPGTPQADLSLAGQPPTPTPTDPLDSLKWGPLARQCLADLGNPKYLKKDGRTLQDWLGELVGAIGEHAGSDLALAGQMWTKYTRSKSWKYRGMTPQRWPTAYRGWAADSGMSQVARPAPAKVPAKADLVVGQELQERGAFLRIRVVDPAVGNGLWPSVLTFLANGRGRIAPRLLSGHLNDVKALAAQGGLEVIEW